MRIADQAAKPARRVRVGDTIEVKRKDFVAVYRVQRIIEKRVGAQIAVECYTDLTPERPKADPVFEAPAAIRGRGQGRPTKRDRRAMDRLRGR